MTVSYSVLRRRLRPVLACLTILAITVPAFASRGSDAFTQALERGPLYAGLAAFAGGLLTSLTPCVYPMIAVTVSVFGARQAKSRLEAMGLSTAFVLGIAAMFTPLGLAAGMTGSLFGAALANRWVVIAIAVIFAVLALSMFGLFEFVLPSGLTNKLATVGGIGFGGAFLLGLVSGIVAAPCTGPVLTGILLWIGKTQSPLLGASALFAFSVGLGVPFWLVGTFAIQLPKSGKWMVGIKSFFGIVLLVTALYFLKNAFPQVMRVIPSSKVFPLAAAGVLVLGIALGAVHLSFDEGKAHAIRKTIGVVFAVVGLTLSLAWLEMPKGHLPWMTSETDALASAKKDNSPVIIDFTAEWCGACKELSRVTFADAVVMSEAARFVLLKVDATNDDDPAVIDIQHRYRVTGLPTVIVLDSKGVEQRRFTDFVPPGPFFDAIRAIQ